MREPFGYRFYGLRLLRLEDLEALKAGQAGVGKVWEAITAELEHRAAELRARLEATNITFPTETP